MCSWNKSCITRETPSRDVITLQNLRKIHSVAWSWKRRSHSWPQMRRPARLLSPACLPCNLQLRPVLQQDHPAASWPPSRYSNQDVTFTGVQDPHGVRQLPDADVGEWVSWCSSTKSQLLGRWAFFLGLRRFGWSHQLLLFIYFYR